MPHEAKLKAFADYFGPKLTLLVHFSDVRPYLGLGELADAGARVSLHLSALSAVAE
jgi:hypothetical protein